MNEAAAALIERTDRVLQGLEDEAIDRIYQALDSSYRRLERELLKAYSQQAENLTLLPNQRKLLILNQVKDLMGLVDSKSAEGIRKNFEGLFESANEQGRSIAASLSEAIANEKLESFADVPIEALKFQAVDGVKRLQRHGEEFASRASAAVEMGLVQGWGSRKVASQLRSELGVTKGRAEAIARTETLSAHNSAIEANFKANDIELFQVFATSDERTCSTCSYRNQQVYKLGESRPPYHVRCRCTIAPIKQSWLDAGLIDVAWSQKYQEDGLQQLQSAGRQPNTGVAPFEKAAGRTTAPQPVWTPGDSIAPQPSASAHQQMIDRGRAIADAANLGDNPSLQQLKTFRRKLIQSGLSAAAAQKLIAQEVGISREAIDRSFRLESDLQDFYRLTGGKIGRGLFVASVTDRAFANTADGYIDLSRKPDASLLYHEVAHVVEASNPLLFQAAKSWRDSRATGIAQKLKDITKNTGYNDDEIAVPDHFINPYVGKVYKYGSTEVISVGLEHFSDFSRLHTLYTEDREHFHLMVGMLDSLRPIDTAAIAPKPATKPNPPEKQSSVKSSGITNLEAEFKTLEKEFDRLLDEDPVEAFRSPTGKRLAEVEEQLKALRASAATSTSPTNEPHQTYIDRGREVAGKKILEKIDKALTPTAQIKKLEAELEAVNKELNELLNADPDAFDLPMSDRYSRAHNKLAKAKQAQEMKAIKAMGALRSQLLQEGNADTAKAQAGLAKILKSALREASEEAIRSTLAEFLQLTGGKGSSSLQRIFKKDDRAYASEDGALNIGAQESEAERRATFWHEMGHHAEFESASRQAVLASWVQSRAIGEAMRLNQMRPELASYGDDEIAYPDKFISEYVGKVYEDGATEVLSVGLEHFESVNKMLELYRRDPEHFFITIGAIRDD